ncbi:Beta-centractin [Chelonia mydas]|uniref:Beta-centractin n=1 Tax=Chelonia mydas TaxID=8469 RepID=M7ARG1_CHEMY|nr:Beta-centractin [Chelonia mydas]
MQGASGRAGSWAQSSQAAGARSDPWAGRTLGVPVHRSWDPCWLSWVHRKGFINSCLCVPQGSGVVKAGFAGDQIPKYCFPNYVGRPKHVRVMAGALEGDLFIGPKAEVDQAGGISRTGSLSLASVGRPKHVRVMAGALEGDLFIGPKAEEHRGLLSIRYPMEHGIVRDWNDMERIWQYVYSKDQLQTFSEEHPVLLTEAPLNPCKNREKAAEVFFETFNVPALFISMQAVLSLYATGRTTGVVLDAGDGVTHAVPIYEGFAMPHSIMRVDVAGRDVSRYLRLLLRKEGYDFHTSAEFEVVKMIKERACYLSINPQKDEALETEKVHYSLPDGSTLEGQRSQEGGVSDDLTSSAPWRQDAIRAPREASLLLPRFGDRLLSEVKKLAPKDVKIKISAPQERLYSTWIGGSILASLDTFKKMWVSKKEYEEDGARAIHRKTF